MLPNYPFTLSFKNTAKVEEDGSDVMLSVPEQPKLRVANPDLSVRTLLRNLSSGGMTDDELFEASVRAAADTSMANSNPAIIYFILSKLSDCGALCYTLNVNDNPFVTLRSIAGPSQLINADLEASYKLSRFAYLRSSEDGMIMECPLGKAAILFHEPQALSAINSLVRGCAIPELAKKTGIGDGAATAFLSLLLTAQMVYATNCDMPVQEESATMRQWEFHDLLFHSRSRLGRHDNGFGPTSRFKDILPPLPAVKPPMSDRRTKLEEPDKDNPQSHIINFYSVLEERKSIRVSGNPPITLRQLGEFLYWVARTKQSYPSDPRQVYEICLRPCPAAGAMHEVELYLTISNCEGLEPGLYHYAPLTHELEWLSDLTPPVKSMVNDARLCSYMESPPDVLITLAARFQRFSWQYESMAYATMLRNVGVMYQQMYLVATALGLAPCALGRANSETFAEATGLDYYVENSIGEFMISGYKK